MARHIHIMQKISNSDIAAVSSKEPLDIQTTAECTFTLKREYNMIRKTHS